MLPTSRSIPSLLTFAVTLAFATPALAGGAGGGGVGCIDTGDSCQVCAAEECPTETAACCAAVGCQDLIVCILDNCADVDLSDQNALVSCASTYCVAEVIAAGYPDGPGAVAAQALGTCVATPLQTPPPGACTECVDGFGMGGAGGGTTSGQGGSTSSAMGGGPGTGGGPSSGSGGGAGGDMSGSGSGASGGDDETEVDDGCGCRVVGTPENTSSRWMVLLGLAGLVGARRRRRG